MLSQQHSLTKGSFFADPPKADEAGELACSFFPEALLNLGATHTTFGQTKVSLQAFIISLASLGSNLKTGFNSELNSEGLYF